MTGVYRITLRAVDGREKQMLAWLPAEEFRRAFYERAERNGLQIVEDKELRV